ncbi:MAG TPA: SUF system NifU family Fe-S cluster assembly protein [Candidatus Thermoplasmatota archaeon]|nr:SUF system NifU family Fe-S cluster assembly protein [Candidatus Thermoplasmatota archaeon]
MDDGLRELYQETILEHNRRPRNFRALEGADRVQEGFNPLCGDRLTLYLRLEGDRIADVAFQGHGCAISTSSASLMTEAVKGKGRADAERLFDGFHRLVTRTPPEPSKEEVGKLLVFSGVGEFPARVKCATLCWHTLKAALAGQPAPATTE